MTEKHTIHFKVGKKRFEVDYEVTERNEHGERRWFKVFKSERPCSCENPPKGGDDDRTTA